MNNKIIYYADERTIIGDKSRSSRKEFIYSSSSGTVNHGPWIPLNEGTYTALISLIADEPSNLSILILDRAGQDLIASQKVSDLDRNSSGEYLFKFTLSRNITKFEIVVKSEQKTSVAISKILVISGFNNEKSIQDYSPNLIIRDLTKLPDFAEFIAPKIVLNNSRKRKGVILSGQCFMRSWVDKMNDVFDFCELILQNNLSTLSLPERPISDYEAHVASLPLRSILPEANYYKEITQELVSTTKDKLSIFFENSLSISRKTGIPVFICNYITPQKSTSGSLKNKYDLKVLIENLNNHLEELISENKNCFLLDVESLASSFGKRFISEDVLVHTNHGSLMENYGFNWDKDRIERFPDFFEVYSGYQTEFIRGIWAEVARMADVISAQNQIKLVAVDLDDTLWRGVLAEDKEIDQGKLIEGWPLGIIEALLNLKSRGILLAIASNNSFEVIEKNWDSVFGERIKLSDFAVIKINWDDKAKKIGEIIHETNLSPGNILFLDDNPRERERVKSVYPEVQIVNAPYYEWKRTLIWPAETSVVEITDESKNKTELIRHKISRDTQKKGLSHAEYLSSLGLRLTPVPLTKNSDTSRAFELLNKTNQFNVAGKKTTPTEFQTHLEAGGLYQFSCSDNTSNYGTIAVLIVSNSKIHQFVMSCRVFGLGIEHSIIAWIQSAFPEVTFCFEFNGTERNTPARNFVNEICDGNYRCTTKIKHPVHIQLHTI